MLLILLAALVCYSSSVRAADGAVAWEYDPVPGVSASPSGAKANGIALGTGAYDGVYITGNDDIGVDSNDWRVEKYSKGGSLIWKKELNIFTGFDDIPSDISVISDGSHAGVYVVGGCHISGGYNGYWCLEKLDFDGNQQFLREQLVGNRESYAASIAIGSDGIYIAGSRGTDSGEQWRIEKRDFNGDLIDSFGTNGEIVSSQIGRFAYDMAIDSTGLYIVGRMEGGGGKWRIEKRNLVTGELIRQEDDNLSGANDRALGVAVSGGSLYVAGDEAVPGTGGAWVVEKRNTSDLSLDFGFGSAGRKEDNPTNGDDTPRKVVLASPYIYIAGEYNERWRIQKRDAASGNLISTYGEELDNKSRVAVDAVLEGGNLYASGTRGIGWRVEKRALDAAPSTLKICENSCSGGILLPSSLTMEKNTSKNLRACYGSASECNDTDPLADITATSASWSEEAGNAAVKLIASGSDEKLEAKETGTENISVTKDAFTKSSSITVFENCICSATPECESTCTSSKCADSCGNNVCSGIKICPKSGDWKEVPPQ